MEMHFNHVVGPKLLAAVGLEQRALQRERACDTGGKVPYQQMPSTLRTGTLPHSQLAGHMRVLVLVVLSRSVHSQLARVLCSNLRRVRRVLRVKSTRSTCTSITHGTRSAVVGYHLANKLWSACWVSRLRMHVGMLLFDALSTESCRSASATWLWWRVCSPRRAR